MSDIYNKCYSFNIENFGSFTTEGKFEYNGIIWCIEVIGNYMAHEDFHEYYHLVKQNNEWMPDPDEDNHDIENCQKLAEFFNKNEPPE